MSSTNMSENKKLVLEKDVLKKILLSNNQKIVKIVAFPKSANSQSSPILIPSSTIREIQSVKSVSPIIIKQHKNDLESESSMITSGSTNTSESQTKIVDPKASSMVISTNTNILKIPDKAVNSESPVTVPISTNILKSRVENTSLESVSLNLPNFLGAKATSSQPVLISQKIKKKKIEYDTNSDNTSTIGSSSNSSSNMLYFSKLESDQSERAVNFNNKEFNNINNSKLQKTTKLSITKTKHMEEKRLKKMNVLLLKQLKLNNALREKVTLMSCTIRRLIKHHSKDYKRFLYDVFNQDQLRFLELKHTNPRSVVTWSDATMKKAAKLKRECGNRGYEELLDQNMPLPSIRTISRWCNLKELPIP